MVDCSMTFLFMFSVFLSGIITVFKISALILCLFLLIIALLFLTV